ncbi:hypothetical protein [Altererythrobacter sp. MF3-039]|uniref:hypothetical protein n=1 Tax=Altererythrobacter sp. MF3-039 TaxID=3252901 RepID=UPI00390C4E29
MRGLVLGGVLTLTMVGIGLFWWQGRAEVEQGAPPPMPAEVSPSSDELPSADITDFEGPEPPEASELSREQRRFFRYDRNRDLRITRNEMLSSRTDAFRKLDQDGNNLLTFEEWAVTTVNRFEEADADGNLELTQREFAATAPKRPANRSRCDC